MKNPDAPQHTDTHDVSLLLFTDNGQLYGVPALSVQEIVYPQPLTPLPFVPPALEGLVSIEGRIAAQVNLARLHGHHTVPERYELVLIETGRTLCALRVDEVLSRDTFALPITPAPAQTNDPIGALVTTKTLWHDRVVNVLAPTALGTLVQPRIPDTTGTGLVGSTLQHTATEQTSVQCLTLTAGNTTYAMPLRCITEILEAEPCTPLPGHHPAVDGLTLLRQHVLLTVDLAVCLGLPRSRTAGTGWFIVIEQAHGRFALGVDTVMEIEQLPSQQYQAGNGTHAAACGVFSLATGNRILLDPEHLLNTELTALLSQHTARDTADRRAAEAHQQFLDVQLADSHFAIPITAVRRIAAALPIEPAHDSSSRIRGAVEMEGRVIPVLALEAALSLSRPTQDKEIILVQQGELEWAIGVDAVQRILTVPLSRISPLQGQENRYVNAVIQLDTGLLSALDFSQIRQDTAA